MLGVLLLLLQAPLDPPRQQREDSKRPTATVEGVVIRADSGEPLARAQVTLVRAAAASAASAADPARASASARDAVSTGADGRFVLKDVEPGLYRVVVARNGFARQEYGQRVFGGKGRLLTLVGGQAIAGIAIRLTAAGSVSGVVQDAKGEPLAGLQVQLLRSTYNAFGQKILQAAGGDRTNDRGEYRVYWVTPGRYYVAVNGAAPGRPVVLPGGSPNEIVERSYPTSYHPGTIDLSQASVIEIQPGVELTAVDVVVPQPDLFRVRGRLVDSITGHRPGTASVSIVQRGAMAAPPGFSGSAPSYNPADDTFDLRDVAPGSYWVRATVSRSSADSLLPASAAGRALADVFMDSLFSKRRVAQVAVDVFSDVDGLVLTLGSGVSIRGLVTIEGQPVSAVPNLERIEVTLRPATTGMIMNPSRHQPMSAQGAFTLENVLPGEYVVSVRSLPPDYYVKDVRIEQTAALDRPLVVSGRVSGALSVVLSDAGGRIDGVVVDDRQRPVSGVEAVLVAARRPTRLDLYKTAITDESGRFVIRGISPGDYKVFAWEAIEAFGYFDEDFLRQSEPDGTSVRITESSTQRVDVKVIPAPVP